MNNTILLRNRSGAYVNKNNLPQFVRIGNEDEGTCLRLVIRDGKG